MATLTDAAAELRALAAADPQVTCMPYTVRRDGSPLSADENDALDRALDAAA